jgi:hypothetical protein
MVAFCLSLFFRFSLQNEQHWSKLLNDMLELQKKTFSCLSIETCLELTMIARLKSKLKNVIQGCTHLIEMNRNKQSNFKVSYKKAVNFILQASIEYFNHSKSVRDRYMELAKY